MVDRGKSDFGARLVSLPRLPPNLLIFLAPKNNQYLKINTSIPQDQYLNQ